MAKVFRRKVISSKKSKEQLTLLNPICKRFSTTTSSRSIILKNKNFSFEVFAKERNSKALPFFHNPNKYNVLTVDTVTNWPEKINIKMRFAMMKKKGVLMGIFLQDTLVKNKKSSPERCHRKAKIPLYFNSVKPHLADTEWYTEKTRIDSPSLQQWKPIKRLEFVNGWPNEKEPKGLHPKSQSIKFGFHVGISKYLIAKGSKYQIQMQRFFIFWQKKMCGHLIWKEQAKRN